MTELETAHKTGQTILVVDDESAILGLCRVLLEQEGYRVLQAAGSSEALKICTNHDGPIDLLVTDLVLPAPGFQLASDSNQFPHVHGHELAVRAATIRDGLRVALMSANPDKELATYGIKRSPLPFLQKPFENDRLVRLVRDTLAGPAPGHNLVPHAKAANDVPWFD